MYKTGLTAARILPALVLAVGLTGCATTKQVEETNARLAQVNQNLATLSAQVAALEVKGNKPAAKPAAGCLLGGQLYSPGSVVAGRICEDTRAVFVSGAQPQWGWEPNTSNNR